MLKMPHRPLITVTHSHQCWSPWTPRLKQRDQTAANVTEYGKRHTDNDDSWPRGKEHHRTSRRKDTIQSSCWRRGPSTGVSAPASWMYMWCATNQHHVMSRHAASDGFHFQILVSVLASIVCKQCCFTKVLVQSYYSRKTVN